MASYTFTAEQTNPEIRIARDEQIPTISWTGFTLTGTDTMRVRLYNRDTGALVVDRLLDPSEFNVGAGTVDVELDPADVAYGGRYYAELTAYDNVPAVIFTSGVQEYPITVHGEGVYRTLEEAQAILAEVARIARLIRDSEIVGGPDTTPDPDGAISVTGTTFEEVTGLAYTITRARTSKSLAIVQTGLFGGTIDASVEDTIAKITCRFGYQNLNANPGALRIKMDGAVIEGGETKLVQTPSGGTSVTVVCTQAIDSNSDHDITVEWAAGGAAEEITSSGAGSQGRVLIVELAPNPGRFPVVP